MASIDVSVEVQVAAAPADVAAVMFDPARETEWVSAVKAVEILDPALTVGARVRHTSRIFSMDVSWLSEVTAVHFPHKLTMRISDGPFTGILDYSIARSGTGSAVHVRNAGEIEIGLPLPGAIISRKVFAALTADLARLKEIVERVSKS